MEWGKLLNPNILFIYIVLILDIYLPEIFKININFDITIPIEQIGEFALSKGIDCYSHH